MTDQPQEPGRASADPGQPKESRWSGGVARGCALGAAALFAAGLATLTVLSEHRDAGHFAVVMTDHHVAADADDPLMAELIRCRDLPPQASDAACARAWDENRRRFFGETRAMRVPGDPLPTYAPIPAAAPTETPPARTASTETMER